MNDLHGFFKIPKVVTETKTVALEDTLKRYFGHDGFLGAQKDIVTALVNGRDSLCVMPTGAGKSLCYQLPALYMEGVTIVISPLIALMNEQVESLNSKGIASICINSSKSQNDNNMALEGISNGMFKVIYIAPERLRSQPFLKALSNVKVSFVAVDEAHCISQWGHDFRPSYLGIPEFIGNFKERPVVGAFTATATEDTRDDMLKHLNLVNPLVKISGFDRPNLYFDVWKAKNKNTQLWSYLSRHRNESGIVYCNTRKQVEAVFSYLDCRGFNVLKYHGGMETVDRNMNQERFMEETSIMVATIAFGMGINKPDIRFVMHYAMPENLENYYQAAGRAGRDGKPAECIILFDYNDIGTIEFFINSRKRDAYTSEKDFEESKARDRRKMKAMEDYCKSGGCYRKRILDYFGDVSKPRCNYCGNCKPRY